MKNVKITICLMVSVLFMATSQGFGDVYFDDGGTHNINYQINDSVWVDYQAPGMQTTVNLISGGVILSPYTLVLFNDSRLNISGGSVHGELQTGGTSQITISGGSVDCMLFAGGGKITISGGTVYNLSAGGTTQITMSGGSIGSDSGLGGESLMTMSGGSVYGDLYGGQIKILGGTVRGTLHARQSSQITMSGGWVGGLHADGGQIIMSGGSAGPLIVGHGGKMTISGGSVYGLSANDGDSGTGQITISGGTIGSPLQLRHSELIIIYGSNFAVDGNTFGFGEITSILGGENEPVRHLTGTLLSGEFIDNYFRIIDSSAKIVLAIGVAPIANAGSDQIVIDYDDNGSEDVGLYGYDSSDSDGTIVSWDWTDNLGDRIYPGGGATLSVGIHTITLTVTDNDGLTDSDTVTIAVVPSTTQPVCIEYPPMDFNKDCKVDFQDFAIFTQSWLDCNLDPPSACWQ